MTPLPQSPPSLAPVPGRIAQVCADRLPITAVAILVAALVPLFYAVVVRWLPVLAVAELVTVGLMAALWRASARRLIPAHRAAMALFAAWSVTAAGVLLIRVVLHDRLATVILALLIAAFGVVQLELFWLVLAFGLATLGWGLVSLTTELPIDGVEVITMVAGLGLGGLMFAVSRDFVIQNESMRALAEQRSRQLADALAAVERELAERKQLELDREQLREQVLAAQKVEVIGNVAGGLASELDSVLTEIAGVAEQAGEGASPAMQDDLGQILGSCQRGMALTRNLIEFGRPAPAPREPVEIGALLAALVDGFGRTLPRRIRIEAGPLASATVHGSDRQLTQAVTNLCLNAADAIPGDGTIAIRSLTCELDEPSARRLRLEPGRYVAIAVRDSGRGMDAETRARMFEPFFTTKPVGQGTGLGLPTVRGIVDDHGGTLDVETAVGIGTTVTIYLPLAEPVARSQPQATPVPRAHATPSTPPRAHPTPTSVPRHHTPAPMARGPSTQAPPARAAVPIARMSVPTPGASAQGGHRILVIDDEVMVRTTIRRVLEGAGHQVVVATGGARGIDLYRREGPFAAVVLDMMMPEMTGAECFRTLRGLDPDVRVVLVSGYSDQGDLRSCLDAGARGFVAKPFNRVELVARVEEAISGPPASRPG